MAADQQQARPLDDLMLAMDVVDTLRHRDLLVQRELASEDRDQRMMERLREIYASQGIEVSDAVLKEGVEALKEERFVYDPPRSGWSRRLARLYVSRNRWGKPVLGVMAAVAVAWFAYAILIRGPAERELAELPSRLETVHDEIVRLAAVPEATNQAEYLLQQGRAALNQGDVDNAEVSLERMESLHDELDLEYELRIVSRPGEMSGVWRVPDANTQARNYYIVVEAVDSDNRVITRPILNEEDGKVYRVDKWALRVDQRVFDRIAADKTDDGIIQNNVFGMKRRGHLEPDYRVETTGRAITDW